MRSQTDGSPWSMRRATRGGGTDVPVTRPERLRAVDVADLAAAFAEFNRGVERARRAYHNEPAKEKPKPTLAERRARFQARKKEAP